jgi:hypothetical protein
MKSKFKLFFAEPVKATDLAKVVNLELQPDDNPFDGPAFFLYIHGRGNSAKLTLKGTTPIIPYTGYVAAVHYEMHVW